MRNLLSILFVLIALPIFGAVPAYTSFRGTGGILITSNPPLGNITIDGSGIFTSSGTNATIATSTNGVLVAVASTNINFIRGSNVVLLATNIGSTTHIAIQSFTPVPFIEGAVTNLLLTWILPILTVDSLTVSNLLAAPPLSSVQYNSNGITRGSAGFIYTNGQVRVADVVIAGQGVEVTAGSFVLNGGDTALVAWNGLGRMRWPTGGVARLEDDFASSFNRLQLGGDTAAFPAIGRTNGDVIILGANGKFKAGDSTNKLRAPAVFIANDSPMGTPLLRLENPLNAIGWDLAINSNPETFLLGLGLFDQNYAMVWELTSGNVGIGITNPTTRLDVQGRFMTRSNVYFPNISSNALPVAFLATDFSGEVFETAVPTGGGGTPGGDSGAIQFNQDDTFAGTNRLNYDRTNEILYVAGSVGIGTPSPTYPLDVQAATGIQRLVSTTAANGALQLFVNDSAAVIGLESAVPGTTVSGSSAHSLLLANQYAYPVQLATDNTVRMTVLPTSGNVGIVTVTPTNALDVSGHTSLRSNLFLANLPTNGSPIAFLATDAAGVVYETAVTVGGSSSSDTNAVLTNLVGTVGRNVTNVISLSTSNATSNPLTNSYTGGVLTLFGLEAGANVTVTPNGSNLVIAATGGGGGGAGSFAVNANQFVTNALLNIKSGALVTNLAIYGSTNLGHVLFSPDNTYDIGASGATRPRSVHVGTDINAGGSITGNQLNSIGGYVGLGSAQQVYLKNGANGVLKLSNAAETDFVMLQLGGTTAAFPAIGRTNGDVFILGGDGAFSAVATNRVHVPGGIVLTNANVAPGKVWTAVGGLGGGTWSNAPAGGGSAALSGHSNAIPYINGAGTALTYYDTGNSLTNPGFGFNPITSGGPQGGYGGLMVFANESLGLVTIGHPNPGADFATFATALTISNRYNGAGDFKNDMVKIDAVLVNASTLQADSTMTRWRVWQAPSGGGASTSSNDVAELTIGGILKLAGGMPTNNAAFTITTNNFALDTYYTNLAQRSWVSASVGMTNVLLTEKAWVGLYLDQDGDGTWERTGINVRLQGISALAGVEQLSAFLQPSARFIFTNLGTAANSSIEANSSQWVRQ